MPWLMHRTSGSCCRLLQGQKGLRLRHGGHDGSLLEPSCKPYFIRIRHSDRATAGIQALKAIVHPGRVRETAMARATPGGEKHLAVTGRAVF
jgi:hypothetical protein